MSTVVGFFLRFDISTHDANKKKNFQLYIHTHFTHEFMVPYLFRPLTFSFPRSFRHSDKHTHFSTDCQQKIMFYLSIQLLCIKTYDYFFVQHSDISILDNLTETRGKCLLIYRLVLNILWLLLLLLCVCFLLRYQHQYLFRFDWAYIAFSFRLVDVDTHTSYRNKSI